MRTRQEIIILFIAGMLLCSCNRFSFNRAFSFNLKTETIGMEASYLPPELYSEYNYCLDEFGICDSVLISYLYEGDYFFMAQSLNSSDTLGFLCRKGRGPEECLLASPFYTIDNGHAYIVDVMKSRLVYLDINKCITSERSSFDGITDLEGEGEIIRSFNMAEVAEDRLLVSYHNNTSLGKEGLADEPAFQIYDMMSGRLLNTFTPFNDISSKKIDFLATRAGKLVALHGKPIPGKSELVFAMKSFPVIGFLDYRDGTMRGIRFKDLPKFKKNKDSYHFMDIAVDKNYIYALFDGFGDPLDSEASETKLLVMDHMGNPKAYYNLGASFGNLLYSDGRLFMRKWSDLDRLYFLYTDLFTSI